MGQLLTIIVRQIVVFFGKLTFKMTNSDTPGNYCLNKELSKIGVKPYLDFDIGCGPVHIYPYIELRDPDFASTMLKHPYFMASARIAAKSNSEVAANLKAISDAC